MAAAGGAATADLRRRIRAWADDPRTTRAELVEVARLVEALGGRGPRQAWSPLPHELWCAVLSFLGVRDVAGSAAAVCRGLRECAADPRAWRTLVLPPGLSAQGATMRLLLMRDTLSRVEAVSLAGWEGAVPPELVATLLPETVRRLDLSRTRATDQTLLEVATSAAGPVLEELAAASCHQLTDVGLTYVARMARLARLDLSGCDITSAGLHYVAESCRGLRVLALDGCDSVDDGALRDVAASCTALEELRLRDCSLATDAALEALASGCSQLGVLRMDGCHRIGDAGLAALGAAGRLRSFRLSAAEGVTDAGVASLAAGCGDTLEDLWLRWCAGVGDAACEAVAASCTRLRVLHLSSCTFVGDRGVQALGAGSGLRRELVELNLNRCSRITNAAAPALASCAALRSLHLVGCHHFNARGLSQIPTHVDVKCEARRAGSGADSQLAAASAARAASRPQPRVPLSSMWSRNI